MDPQDRNDDATVFELVPGENLRDSYTRALSAAQEAWTTDLAELALAIRIFDYCGSALIGPRSDTRDPAIDRLDAARLAIVLQARSTLEAAEVQRTEAQALVRVTWWLVGATWALAIVAVVAIILAR